MNKETSEIAKLTVRISQDPKSKLFVPLAEEYKKAGDIEMAIHVLLEGLKNNPEYVTARSSLGKLLLAKGDMAGAQKEFEEVVRNVPDNLMAQKKLGDLHIIQNRPQDALPHYKIALDLNPSDGELASLISDLEAGRDISSKIQLTKSKLTDAQAAVKQEPLATLAATGPASAPVSVPLSKPAYITQVENTPVSPAPFSEVAPTPVSLGTETEEPEEVLIVEPLEPEASGSAPPVYSLDLSGEHSPDAVPAVEDKESPDVDVSARSHAQDESTVAEDIPLAADLFTLEDKEMVQPEVSQLTAADDIVDAAFDEEITETVPEGSLKAVPEKSDDFTTDTLAELYIAQGFFEKAIEIYERMLVDNPNSRGLKDKLAWVKAAAVQPGISSTEQKKGPEIHVEQGVGGDGFVAEDVDIGGEPSIFDELEGFPPKQEHETKYVTPEVVLEATEDVPTVEPEEMAIHVEDLAIPGEYKPGEPPLVENLFTESSEYKPAPETKEHPTAGEAGLFDELSAAEQSRPEPQYLDFEPREYIPSQTEQLSPKPSAEKISETENAGIPGRKEVIARLETWLTAIKKEK